MIVSAVNLGCKVNEYETQSMLFQLKSAGHEIVEWPNFADLYIVNTCAVTNTGERKSRQFLSKILKINPNAKIVVTGCASQNNASNFSKLENVVAITGNQGKENILSIIDQHNLTPIEINNDLYTETAKPLETRARQYIKIQDGCNYFCSYCLIPYLRGRSRSRNLQDVLNEIRNTSASEIVLTGINMSDYRIDNKLALKTLVKEVDKLGKRFRISSIECNVLDDEMIDILSKLKNFCHHFHLSLQSACNDTLKRMNRRYSIEEFTQITRKLREKFSDCCISTDIIVGFKGETDSEFENTVENLKNIQFDFMHIFPYSERKGTLAEKLSNPVPSGVIKQREKVLQQLNLEFKTKFYQKNLNTTHNVLVEIVDGNFCFGYTDNYIYTKFIGVHKIGEIVPIKLTSIVGDTMVGEE